MKRNKRNPLKHLIFKDCWKAMRLATLFQIAASCLTGIVSVYCAEILGSFADAVLQMDTAYGIQNAVKLAVCVFITVVFIPIFEMFESWIMLKYALLHDRMVLGRFLDKRCLAVAKLDAGELQYRLEDDPCDFRIYLVLIVTNLCTAFATAVFLGYHIRRIYFGFTICAILLMLLKICVPMALKKIRARYDNETRDYQAAFRACESEITEKPHVIRLLGLKNPLIKRLDNLFQTYYKTVFKKSAVYAAIADTAASYLNQFCILAILFIGAVMVAKGRIFAGEVAAMAGYFGVMGNIIEAISYVITNYPILDNLAERMELFYSDSEASRETNTEQPMESLAKLLTKPFTKLLAKPLTEPLTKLPTKPLTKLLAKSLAKPLTEPLAKSPTKSLMKPSAESFTKPLINFSIKDLSFAYEGHTILKDFNLHVKEKEKLAICGENGSGKSTLAKLLCGLYDKYNGRFLINGQAADKMNIRDRRRQFAYAVQEPFLFCGTVEENICLGNPSAPKEKVLHIMEELNLNALAKKTVSMKQNDLSGGERQKISIARALLKDAPVLILDEPESSLDTNSVEKLARLIKTTEKTVIFITHDERLLKAADRVICL